MDGSGNKPTGLPRWDGRWLSFAKSPADFRITKIRRGFVTLSHGELRSEEQVLGSFREAQTTGLKGAPEIGPNVRMSATRAALVA